MGHKPWVPPQRGLQNRGHLGSLAFLTEESSISQKLATVCLVPILLPQPLLFLLNLLLPLAAGDDNKQYSEQGGAAVGRWEKVSSPAAAASPFSTPATHYPRLLMVAAISNNGEQLLVNTSPGHKPCQLPLWYLLCTFADLSSGKFIPDLACLLAKQLTITAQEVWPLKCKIFGY